MTTIPSPSLPPLQPLITPTFTSPPLVIPPSWTSSFDTHLLCINQILLIISTSLFLITWFSHWYLSFIICIIATSLSMFIHRSKWQYSRECAANITWCILWTCITYVVVTSGGITSPAVAWFVYLPVMTSYTCTIRWMPIATCLASTTSLTFITLYPHDNLLSPSQVPTFASLCFGSCLITLTWTCIWTRDTLIHMYVKEMNLAQERVKNQMQAEKHQFARSMSHEIRTPMNGIHGACQLLLEEDLNPEARSLANIIVQSTSTLLVTTNDILDFARLECGESRLEYAPFNLRHLVNDVHSLLMETAIRKGLDFAVEWNELTPSVFVGDAIRIRQIMINIIGNALKFTQQGHVHISISHRNMDPTTSHQLEQHFISTHRYRMKSIPMNDIYSMIDIRISDSGCGIPPDVRQHIFTGFSQVDQSSTKKYQGAGLGLALCKNLCRLMGGDITVASIINIGSIFHISIPLRTIIGPHPEQYIPKSSQSHTRRSRKRDHITSYTTSISPLRTRARDTMLHPSSHKHKHTHDTMLHTSSTHKRDGMMYPSSNPHDSLSIPRVKRLSRSRSPSTRPSTPVPTLIRVSTPPLRPTSPHLHSHMYQPSSHNVSALYVQSLPPLSPVIVSPIPISMKGPDTPPHLGLHSRKRRHTSPAHVITTTTTTSVTPLSEHLSRTHSPIHFDVSRSTSPASTSTSTSPRHKRHRTSSMARVVTPTTTSRTLDPSLSVPSKMTDIISM